MLQLFKRKKKDKTEATQSGTEPNQASESATVTDSIPPEKVDTSSNTQQSTTTNPGKPNLFARLRAGLRRTKHSIADGVANIFLGKKQIDAELLENLETLLLTADIGIKTTEEIVKQLSAQAKRKELDNPEVLTNILKQILINILKPVEQPLVIPKSDKPFVILMVGVNGTGKTTSIGKLTNQLQQQGKKVILAAGDTFRAAAIEQLQVWGERNSATVIAQQSGSDSASVIFDAMQAATARNYDVLLADSAGRLHTQNDLMDELKKVKRVIGKLDTTAPHEVLLVLDASIGQNAISQAQKFKDAVGVSGIILTKLDGTAKGGVIFAIASQLQLPIRYIGVGEGIDDLQPFNAEEFIAALFS